MESTALNIDGIFHRKALPHDIDDLLPLYQTLFARENDFIYEANKQRQALRLLIDGPQSVVFVTVWNNSIIAMCNMQTYVSTAAGGYAGIIEDVVIDGRFRGLGIGAELLNICESFAKARGLKRLHLLMDRNNELGLRFYTGQNWKQTRLTCLQKLFDE